MMKILVLCILLSFSSSCIFLPVAGVAITTSTMAAKYKWHRDEVEKIKEYRESVLSEFKEINRKLEKLTK